MARRVVPAIGFVNFASDDGKYLSTALLGDGPATPTGGYGGWTTKERPRNRAFTIWTGNDPLRIDIPILYDYFSDDEVNGGLKCEAQIRQLEKMAGLEAGMTEPPLIYFDSGGAIPHDNTDAPHLDWVIENIQWGDIIRNTYGNRTRQAAVVQVMEFVPDNQIGLSPALKHRHRRSATHKRGAKNKIYIVKRGDTLRKIAAKELHDHKRWHEIARLNGIRDGMKLTAGMKIKLP
jgi:hypothetical protein